MNESRRNFVMVIPALTTAITYPSKEAFACMGELVVENIRYIQLHTLKNYIPFGTHQEYLAKYYPGTQVVYLDATQFSIITPEINENAAVVPLTVVLPRELHDMPTNGLGYNPATLRCIRLEIVYQSERLKKRDFETDFQGAPLGTFQLCAFTFPEAEITEATLRYRRWDPSRLIAIATMSNTDKKQPPLILVSMTGPLKHHACEGPRFVP